MYAFHTKNSAFFSTAYWIILYHCNKKTAILFPYNINWFAFLIEVQGVACEVGPETYVSVYI
jgi:hypothetical protein